MRREDVADDPCRPGGTRRAVGVEARLPWDRGERRQVGDKEHVRLGNARKALDAAAVEPLPVLDGLLELMHRDLHRFHLSHDVGELEADEAQVLLLGELERSGEVLVGHVWKAPSGGERNVVDGHEGRPAGGPGDRQVTVSLGRIVVQSAQRRSVRSAKLLGRQDAQRVFGTARIRTALLGGLAQSIEHRVAVDAQGTRCGRHPAIGARDCQQGLLDAVSRRGRDS